MRSGDEGLPVDQADDWQGHGKARSMIWLQLLRSSLLIMMLLPVPGCGQGRATEVPLSQPGNTSSAPPPSPARGQLYSPPDGFPNSTNTGPVAGTIFQDFAGIYEIRKDGAFVDGLRVTGSILVYANNVTIQNCEVDASG